jgi:two-component system, NtrC family, sensor histidine kinase HydH
MRTADVHPTRWRRRFAGLSLLSVLVTAMLSAMLLSHGMAERMLRNHGELSQTFIDSLLRLHGGHVYFTQADTPEAQAIEPLFGELSRMSGLLHANVYNAQRRIIWSTNRTAVGQAPGVNPELEEALLGEVAIESALLARASFFKPEHAFVPDAGRDAIETYVPVRDPVGRVVGVIELYQSPQGVIDAVHTMTRAVWVACAGSGLFIFLALYGLAWQADRQIDEQQRRMVANESLAAVGDMASAVAHGIRNPLAAIRSSAELLTSGPDASLASDIMGEVDRLQAWVRQLLAYAQQGGRSLGPIALQPLLEQVLAQRLARIERQGVAVWRDWPAHLPDIQADGPALAHAIDNLLVNALDAMPRGGTLSLSARAAGASLIVELADSGPGIPAAALAQVFTPFHTTKRTGLGVGLPMVRRTVERLGGEVRLVSQPGLGTRAVLRLPLAPNAGTRPR